MHSHRMNLSQPIVLRGARPHHSTELTLKRDYKTPRTRNGRETEESRCWNMKRLKLLTLVGITSMALANAGWAAGHGGGGGGFGGGGFSGGGGGHAGGGGGGARAGAGGFHGGGGFQAGGFHGGGQVTQGVGSRGGGVGFGGMRMPNGVPNFEGAGPRFSSFGHPSHAQRQVTDARAQASRLEVARQSDPRFSSLRNH